MFPFRNVTLPAPLKLDAAEKTAGPVTLSTAPVSTRKLPLLSATSRVSVPLSTSTTPLLAQSTVIAVLPFPTALRNRPAFNNNGALPNRLNAVTSDRRSNVADGALLKTALLLQ